MQRWGQIAKKRWGRNAKMKYYSVDNLMKVAESRGYMSVKALADALVKPFGTTSRVIQGRIVTGSLTKAECEVIGSLLEMSMREYYDVFMVGLFVVNSSGHYVCHVDEPYLHLHPTGGGPGARRIKSSPEKKPRKDTVPSAQEILEQLKDY